MSDQHDDANPEWTEADFANALPPEGLPPHILAAFPKTVARIKRTPIAADKHRGSRRR